MTEMSSLVVCLVVFLMISSELIFQTRVPNLEGYYFFEGPGRSRDEIIAPCHLQYITKGTHNLLAVKFRRQDLKLDYRRSILKYCVTKIFNIFNGNRTNH
jgi:hypothetical protein